MTFWETALASGLGSALGALAAFTFNWLINHLERRKTNILAEARISSGGTSDTSAIER